MKTVTAHEAKTHLSMLVAEVEYDVCTRWRGGALELPTTPRRGFGAQTHLRETEPLSVEIEHYDRESELPVLRAYPVAVVW